MPISTGSVSVPQIGQNIDPSIYGNQQAQQGMTLGDLLNVSRGSIALQKEKALLPSAIEQGQAQAKTAALQANTAQLENNIKHATVATQNIQQLMTKKDLSSQDIIDMVKQTADTHGGNEQSVKQALTGLPANGSQADLRAWLAQKLAASTGALSQLEKLYPQGVLPGQLPAGGYQQPSGQQVPGAQQAPQGVSAQDMNLPPKTEVSAPVKLSYPVRQAGQPYSALPQEEDERKIGTATKTALIARQAEIPQSERTINRVIEKANELGKTEWGGGAGVLGSAGRNLSTFLGTEQGIAYKELSKDLANAAIANIKAQGGSLDTVQGQQLTRMANGDETFPPKVLIEIAQRTKADMSAINSKATAVKKFADKFGDQNISAFNQMWSKNADPDIFQLKNIFESNMSKQEKEAARNKIIGNDPEKAKLFREKWNNIQKLEQTGTL